MAVMLFPLLLSRERALTGDLDDYLARASRIKLHQENALPATQQYLPLAHRNGLTGVQEQMQAMRVRVGAFVLFHIDGAAGKVIVVECSIARAQPLQKRFDVLKQERFIFVNFDGSRGMTREDQNRTLDDTRGAHRCLNLIGNID